MRACVCMFMVSRWHAEVYIQCITDMHGIAVCSASMQLQWFSTMCRSMRRGTQHILCMEHLYYWIHALYPCELNDVFFFLRERETWRGVFTPGRNKKKEIKCQMEKETDGTNTERNQARNVNKKRDREREGIPWLFRVRTREKFKWWKTSELFRSKQHELQNQPNYRYVHMNVDRTSFLKIYSHTHRVSALLIHILVLL